MNVCCCFAKMTQNLKVAHIARQLRFHRGVDAAGVSLRRDTGCEVQGPCPCRLASKMAFRKCKIAIYTQVCFPLRWFFLVWVSTSRGPWADVCLSRVVLRVAQEFCQWLCVMVPQVRFVYATTGAEPNTNGCYVSRNIEDAIDVEFFSSLCLRHSAAKLTASLFLWRL